MRHARPPSPPKVRPTPAGATSHRPPVPVGCGAATGASTTKPAALPSPMRWGVPPSTAPRVAARAAPSARTSRASPKGRAAAPSRRTRARAVNPGRYRAASPERSRCAAPQTGAGTSPRGPPGAPGGADGGEAVAVTLGRRTVPPKGREGVVGRKQPTSGSRRKDRAPTRGAAAGVRVAGVRVLRVAGVRAVRVIVGVLHAGVMRAVGGARRRGRLVPVSTRRAQRQSPRPTRRGVQPRPSGCRTPGRVTTPRRARGRGPRGRGTPWGRPRRTPGSRRPRAPGWGEASSPRSRRAAPWWRCGAARGGWR